MVAIHAIGGRWRVVCQELTLGCWVIHVALIARKWKSTTMLAKKFLIAIIALEYNDRTMHICYYLIIHGKVHKK